jgi:hypothetical protein
MATFTWTGYDQIQSQLGRLIDPDATPLMEEWEHILVADNRRGVLAGEDGDGNPMRPVTYRPRGGSLRRVSPKQRNRTRAGKGVFAGAGPYAAGLNNNLSREEYLRLGGPPLAPRGANSRVITNYFTAHGREGNQWFAAGAWFEVVSNRGVPFLEAHFTGASTGRGHAVHLPRRDLRGVRPQGRQEAVVALNKWLARLLKG